MIERKKLLSLHYDHTYECFHHGLVIPIDTTPTVPPRLRYAVGGGLFKNRRRANAVQNLSLSPVSLA